MTITLSEKVDSYVKNLKKTSWHLAISEAFGGQKISHELLKELMSECLNQGIATKQECLTFFQHCLALVFLYQSHFELASLMQEDLNPLLLKLQSCGFFQNSSLFSIYKKVLTFFLNGKKESFEINLTQNMMVFVENEGFDSEDHLPHQIKNAELGVLVALYALITNDVKILKLSVKIAEAQKKILDHSQAFFPGIWIKEEDYNSSALSFINVLFFGIVSSYAPGRGFEEVYQTLSKSFSLSSLSLFSVVYPLLHLFLKEKSFDHCTSFLEQQSIDLVKDLGLGCSYYHYGALSCVCTASGAGSGFASLKKNKVEIVSMGPQSLPLGDMTKYGIYRTALMKHDPFKDVIIEKRDDLFYFDGWTRLLDQDAEGRRPGKSWMHINLCIEKNIADLSLKWVNFTQNPELYLVFFVKAHKAIIDKTYHLHPYTLDRYEGKVAEIVFQNGQDLLVIQSDMQEGMQVIPLSGGEHFWGAEFLIAYRFPKDQAISFKIT